MERPEWPNAPTPAFAIAESPVPGEEAAILYSSRGDSQNNDATLAKVRAV
jgi:hypothetical protein